MPAGGVTDREDGATGALEGRGAALGRTDAMPVGVTLLDEGGAGREEPSSSDGALAFGVTGVGANPFGEMARAGPADFDAASDLAAGPAGFDAVAPDVARIAPDRTLDFGTAASATVDAGVLLEDVFLVAPVAFALWLASLIPSDLALLGSARTRSDSTSPASPPQSSSMSSVVGMSDCRGGTNEARPVLSTIEERSVALSAVAAAVEELSAVLSALEERSVALSAVEERSAALSALEERSVALSAVAAAVEELSAVLSALAAGLDSAA